MRKVPAKKRAQPKRAVKAKRPAKPPVAKAAPKHVVVTVLRTDNGVCIVDPPEASVRPGGTVAFKSKAGRLTVFVPTPSRAANLFPRARGPVFGVPAKGKKLIVSVAKPKTPVVYTYAVYCHKYKEFAKASFPRIIVV
jgi:hypothetical protein